MPTLLAVRAHKGTTADTVSGAERKVRPRKLGGRKRYSDLLRNSHQGKAYEEAFARAHKDTVP
jgi:hypothetical protein